MLNKSRLGLFFWLALACTGIGLCLWQLGRAQEKQQMIDLRKDRMQPVALGQSLPYAGTVSAAALDQQRMLLNGRWLMEKSVFLDNRANEGRAGVHVLTPLVLADGSVVWINRGWMPKPPGVTDGLKPPPAEPARSLAGVALSSVMRRMELSSDPSRLRHGALWQNFDWDASHAWLMAPAVPSPSAGKSQSLAPGPAQSFGPVWPVIVWQSDDNGDGLVRKIPEVSSDVPKHLGYAAQWFALAMVALFFAWRLGRKTERLPSPSVGRRPQA